MSSVERRSLAEGIIAADKFRVLFDGCYESWTVAGSIRRKCSTIGDIEHVVSPLFQEPPVDLLGSAMGKPVNLVRKRVDDLLRTGAVKLHRYGTTLQTRNGPTYVGVDHDGVLNELFMPGLSSFGSSLAIRTGSAEFSKALVTIMQRNGYRQQDGALWIRRGQYTGPGGPDVQEKKFGEETYVCIPCVDEETFFEACGLDLSQWPPELRTDDAANRLRARR